MTFEELTKSIESARKDILGWCSADKAKRLAELIVQYKLSRCLEIGVFGGSSLVPIAMAVRHLDIPGSSVVGVDPWRVPDALDGMIEQANKDWWSGMDMEAIYQHCLLQIRKQALESIVTLLRNRSDEIVDKFPDGHFDFLHIDGNHCEKQSYFDATHFLPKVRPGGIIAFDDIYWAENQTVTTRKAVTYLSERCKQLGVVSDCMLLQKQEDGS